MIGDGLFERREESPPFFRDFPSESIANDKLRRKDIQIRRLFGQPLHAIDLVTASVHQDLHGPSDFGNRSPPGLAGQHFQDGQLEGRVSDGLCVVRMMEPGQQWFGQRSHLPQAPDFTGISTG